jgi:hypothetical protein
MAKSFTSDPARFALLRAMIADSVLEADDGTCNTYFDKIPLPTGRTEVENREYA